MASSSASGVVSGLFDGWQLSQVTTLQSAPAATSTIRIVGTPFPGAAFPTSLNGLGGSDRVPFLPFSNLDIDEIYRVDVRITRQFALTRRVRLSASLEVFNLFNRPGKGRDHAPHGLGIGLALARKLVELHGGTVEARSEGHRRGSEFTVRLPLDPTQAGAATAGPAADAPAASRRVLVVDDSPDAADSLGIVLALHGFETQTAHDGRAALESLEGFRPAVVLLDLRMPGMSGYEVAERLRQHPLGRDVTVIVLTGWGEEEDRQQRPEPPGRRPALVERQRVMAARPVAPRDDPVRIRQRLEVSAHGRLWKLQHGAQLRHGQLLPLQQEQHTAPHRVRQDAQILEDFGLEARHSFYPYIRIKGYTIRAAGSTQRLGQSTGDSR